ncbi:MAG: GDP-mannose 4,6-dehydratase, partial [Desulfobacterales bacterium]
MKNMLITGGCGFIGSNFIRYLLRESDYTGRIINLDKLTYAGNPENMADVQKEYPDRYIFIQADICDGPRIAEIFDGFQIDGICHFAAESHVDRSIVEPDAFIQTNIVGTFNLLEAARSRLGQMIRFHHVSTDEVYGSLG